MDRPKNNGNMPIIQNPDPPNSDFPWFFGTWWRGGGGGGGLYLKIKILGSPTVSLRSCEQSKNNKSFNDKIHYIKIILYLKYKIKKTFFFN